MKRKEKRLIHCILTLIMPGLLRKHVVGKDSLFGLRVSLCLKGDKGLGLNNKKNCCKQIQLSNQIY